MRAHLRTVLTSHDRNRDEGASAVEYGLLVAGIAAVIIVIVFALGGTLTGLFSGVNTCIANPDAATCDDAEGGTPVDPPAEG